MSELGPGEALLRVEGCGMCGSDVELYEGLGEGVFSRFPVIPGHEFVGRIEALDARVREAWGLDAGARVAVIGGPRCGMCANCSNGQRCLRSLNYGFRTSTIGSGLWGGFAEYVHLAAGTRVRPLPEELSAEDAVLFNPLAAGFEWVVRAAQTRPGDSVAILGPGQRGLACVIAAREAGAGEIIVTGLVRDEPKLALARELGATATFLADDADLVRAVKKLTRGGADRVIDTTPMAWQPVLDALELVRMNGTIVLAGLKGGKPVPAFPVDVVTQRMLTIVGVLSSSDWASDQAIRTIVSGRYPLGKLHTHTFGLDGVERALQLLAGKVEGETAIHITIVP